MKSLPISLKPHLSGCCFSDRCSYLILLHTTATILYILYIGCILPLQVTPQPAADVRRHHFPLTYLLGCPVTPILLPLPNVVVNQGSTFTFKAKYAMEPFPKPELQWYFSSDQITCTRQEKIMEKNGSVNITGRFYSHFYCF